MKLFAIHAPRAAEAFVGPEGARAAKTGFSVAALAFGPLWLLAWGLWFALIEYAALATIVVVAASEGWLRVSAAVLLFALGNLYLAVEGRALAMRARWSAGRPLVDLIYAHSALEAEKLYLERTLVAGAAPMRRADAAGDLQVIGLFPEPGR